MKKIAIMFVSMAMAFSSFAQYSHHFSVSGSANSSLKHHLGDYSDEAGDDIFFTFLHSAVTGQDFLSDLLDNEYDWVTSKSTKQQQHFNIAYEVALGEQKRWRTGTSVSIASFTHVKTWNSGRETRTSENFEVVSINNSYVWFKRAGFELSSGIGLGVTKHNATGAINESRLRPAAHFTPVRAAAYLENIGIFIEPGIGARGFEGGLAMRF